MGSCGQLESEFWLGGASWNCKLMLVRLMEDALGKLSCTHTGLEMAARQLTHSQQAVYGDIASGCRISGGYDESFGYTVTICACGHDFVGRGLVCTRHKRVVGAVL